MRVALLIEYLLKICDMTISLLFSSCDKILNRLYSLRKSSFEVIFGELGDDSGSDRVAQYVDSSSASVENPLDAKQDPNGSIRGEF